MGIIFFIRLIIKLAQRAERVQYFDTDCESSSLDPRLKQKTWYKQTERNTDIDRHTASFIVAPQLTINV